MAGSRYLVGDVASVAGGLQVQVWGQYEPTSVRLHSGHPLEVGDRVYMVEVYSGMWLCLGPIVSSVDYFPLPEEVDPETDPPPLVITAGKVTDDGEDIDLNDGTRCPYSGAAPDDDRKVVTFAVGGDCLEIPGDPVITSDPTSPTVTPQGTVTVVDASTGVLVREGVVGVTLRAVSALLDRAGNSLTGLRFVWYRDGVATSTVTRDFSPTQAGSYRVGVSAVVGGVTYREVASQTVVVTDPLVANTAAAGDVTISVGGDAGPVPGALLVANTSAITDDDGLTMVVWSYQWKVAGVVVSFQSSLAVPAGQPAGSLVELKVTFADDLGLSLIHI